MNMTTTSARIFMTLVGFLSVSTFALEAETISGVTVEDFSTGQGVMNLQTLGTTDWVQFGVSGSSTAFELTNEKSGGSVGALDTVGAVSESNDSIAGQTQDTSNLNVSYSNGTNPTLSSATVDSQPAGNWSIQVGYDGSGNTAITDAALSLTIDFNQALSSGDIYLGANSYQETGELFASLSNGNSTTTTETNTGSNLYDVFDVHVIDITAGSSLTLKWEAPETTNGYDNISLSGIALDLTSAPEPSTYALIGFGVATLVIVARFRRLTL
jgi:hypothetical protein